MLAFGLAEKSGIAVHVEEQLEDMQRLFKRQGLFAKCRITVLAGRSIQA